MDRLSESHRVDHQRSSQSHWKNLPGFNVKGDVRTYPIGKTILWEGFSSCTTKREVAVGFSKGGTVFEIESVSGRQIKQFSVYDTEDEVLLLPYTCFQVLEATPSANGNPAIVKLREIPVPRSFNVICWVDDIPSNNGKYILPCEKKGISVLPITSTKLALNFLRDYRWLFYLKNSQFKIVTDMVREEEELESTKVSKNYEAGILLIQKIQEEHKYGHKILVFCTDTKKKHSKIAKQKIWIWRRFKSVLTTLIFKTFWIPFDFLSNFLFKFRNRISSML